MISLEGNTSGASEASTSRSTSTGVYAEARLAQSPEISTTVASTQTSEAIPSSRLHGSIKVRLAPIFATPLVSETSK